MPSRFVYTGRLNHCRLLSLKQLWAVCTAALGTWCLYEPTWPLAAAVFLSSNEKMQTLSVLSLPGAVLCRRDSKL